MKKNIKIFLGSSIVEFELERLKIENFIYRLSRNFEKNYNLSIDPILCENMDDAYSVIRKQNIINKIVGECDYCFFIFFTKAGKYTLEEFEAARKRFEEIKKPKIYTYFKVLKEEKAEDELHRFIDRLDKGLGHYYRTFEHIDTVLLKILLTLKVQEVDICEIDFDGNNFSLDGKKILAIDNISEFANNEGFQKLNVELRETEEMYSSVKKDYFIAEWSDDKRREYFSIAAKRKELLNSLAELRCNIFETTMRMCYDEEKGILTPEQKEAYRLFEAGDLEGANRIFNYEEMKKNLQQTIETIDMGTEILNADKRNAIQIFIRNSRTYIGILAIDTGNSSRFDVIEKVYKDITELAFEANIEIDVIIDFVWFLFAHGKREEAYITAKKTEEHFSTYIDEKTRARLCHVLGFVCADFDEKQDEAENYYFEAIRIREMLADENPEAYEFLLSRSYNNLADFYARKGKKKNVERYYLRAIDIRERLAERDFEKNAPLLADSCNSLGAFYLEQKKIDEADEYLLKAVDILEKLYAHNSDKYIIPLADCYNNIVKLIEYPSSKCNQIPYMASEYCQKAIKFNLILAAEKPEIYEVHLAVSYMTDALYGRDSLYYEKALNVAKRHPESLECRKILFKYVKRAPSSRLQQDHRQVLFEYVKNNLDIPDCKQIFEYMNGWFSK